MNYENRFYETLEKVFVGAPIEGEGGYVNLLKVKEKYYRKILTKFKEEVNTNPIIDSSFKENFFELLYNFFEKYFSECGSVYFVKTANYQRIYEKVYSDSKDVALFWKTNTLYYIKSDILFKSMYVTVDDDKNESSYVFYFDVGELRQKQNNEKKELLFSLSGIKNGKVKNVHRENSGNKTFVLSVGYCEGRKKTDIDEISQQVNVDKSIIEKAIKIFKKQASVDFFINKNANTFLTEQLEIFIHQYLLDEKSDFDSNRLAQLKTYKNFCLKLIDFVSQFENELVRIWNKPKFVKNSNYVISIDKIAASVVGKLENHPGMEKQIQEWVNLGIVDSSFTFNSLQLANHPYLPIDTKYFKDLELEIISIFDNVSDELNGYLIHSDNYQALNTLGTKFLNSIQTIYIDPPFNTGSDFEYLDGLQDSTWLTFMDNRLEKLRPLLVKEGSMFLHLDRYANYYGRKLLDDTFGKDNYINEIVWRMGWVSGYKTQIDAFVRNHDTIFYYGKEKKYTFFDKTNSKIDYKTFAYKDFEEEFNSIKKKMGLSDEQIRNLSLNILTWNDESLRIYPSNKDFKEGKYNIEDTWNCNVYEAIDSNKIKRNVAEYTPNGSKITQKPEELLERIIKLTTKENDYVLDCFSGSGTTVATAHKLHRKWVGIEMGDYFNTDVLVRMKWVVSGKEVGISKKVNWKGGGFFKYFELEQYEDTLNKAVYNPDLDVVFENDPFSQYVFFADQKFTDFIKRKGDSLNVDFGKLFENIDLPETISNVLGKGIRKIDDKFVYLNDIDKPIKYNLQQMSEPEKLEFLQLIKPLIWWGE